MPKTSMARAVMARTKWTCWRSGLLSRARARVEKQSRETKNLEPYFTGMHEISVAAAAPSAVKLRKVATCPKIRVLAWDDDVLYACRGYELIRLKVRSTVTQQIQQEARLGAGRHAEIYPALVSTR